MHSLLFIIFIVGFIQNSDNFQYRYSSISKIKCFLSQSELNKQEYNDKLSFISNYSNQIHDNQKSITLSHKFNFKIFTKPLATMLTIISLMFNALPAISDDELAKFAAEGNTVGVDGQCFMRKCSLETAKCANDQTCLKGLSCLAR